MANSQSVQVKPFTNHGRSGFRANLVKLFERKISIKKSVYFVILRSYLGLRGSSDTWKICCFQSGAVVANYAGSTTATETPQHSKASFVICLMTSFAVYSTSRAMVYLDIKTLPLPTCF
jgi:hypothetical protein